MQATTLAIEPSRRAADGALRAMRRPRVVVLLVTLCMAIGGMYALRQRGPVLFTVSLDGSLRPRGHAVLNPFRDREPERARQSILDALRRGHPEIIRPLVPAESLDHSLAREQQYRILSWRVGAHQDIGSCIMLTYCVSRGGGYPGEEEVSFGLTRTGQHWVVSS
jgi:hypothetical protein